MKRSVISEQTVRDEIARGSRRLIIPEDAIVTELASELAVSKGVVLERGTARPVTPQVSAPSPLPSGPVPVVAIGSDHGGFAMKKLLIEFLGTLGAQVIDLGTTSEDPVDYPDYAHKVAVAVVKGNAGLGIMIDGAGIGSCMAVNKVQGIRGACCAHEFTAKNAREHNNANVLTLGSRVVGLEVAKGIVRTFLQTPFAGGRHEARVNKIMEIEKRKGLS
jgi:ribose 5-phosphate isomerase B